MVLNVFQEFCVYWLAFFACSCWWITCLDVEACFIAFALFLFLLLLIQPLSLQCHIYLFCFKAAYVMYMVSMNPVHFLYNTFRYLSVHVCAVTCKYCIKTHSCKHRIICRRCRDVAVLLRIVSPSAYLKNGNQSGVI